MYDELNITISQNEYEYLKRCEKHLQGYKADEEYEIQFVKDNLPSIIEPIVRTTIEEFNSKYQDPDCKTTWADKLSYLLYDRGFYDDDYFWELNHYWSFELSIEKQFEKLSIFDKKAISIYNEWSREYSNGDPIHRKLFLQLIDGRYEMLPDEEKDELTGLFDIIEGD